MNETTIRAGVEAARAIIHEEHAPTTASERAALTAVCMSLTHELRALGDGSPYQAVTTVLARHNLAGCPVVTRIHASRRQLVASRIARAFAFAHLAELANGAGAT